MVDALYQKPFITGLVRPSNRRFYNPDPKATEQGEKRGLSLSKYLGAKRRMSSHKGVAVRAELHDSATPELDHKATAEGAAEAYAEGEAKATAKAEREANLAKTRRYYAPQHIGARDFASALIEVIREGGTADRQKTRLVHSLYLLPPGDLRTSCLA